MFRFLSLKYNFCTYIDWAAPLVVLFKWKIDSKIVERASEMKEGPFLRSTLFQFDVIGFPYLLRTFAACMEQTARCLKHCISLAKLEWSVHAGVAFAKKDNQIRNNAYIFLLLPLLLLQQRYRRPNCDCLRALSLFYLQWMALMLWNFMIGESINLTEWKFRSFNKQDLCSHQLAHYHKHSPIE